MKWPCQRGDRIRLIHMPHDPAPIPDGTTGTVLSMVPWLNGEIQIMVKWDIERSLAMIYPVDQFEILPHRTEPKETKCL